MNIGVIGKFYTEGFALHISDTFKEMGHQVYEYIPGRNYTASKFKIFKFWDKAISVLYEVISQAPYFMQRETKRLDEWSKNKSLDLIVVCHDFLTPQQVKTFWEKSIPIVMWFPDQISQFRKCFFINAPYSSIYFKDPYIVNTLSKEYGLDNVFYLPECANIAVHRPLELSELEKKKFNCEVAFAGNLHSFRVALIKQLKKYNIKIWGHSAPLWMDVDDIKSMITGEFVANETKSKAFLGAKININNLHPAEVTGVNVRTFEIAACGGFQICSYREELENLYTIGEEIETYKNVNELKDKINYYLNNKEKRDQIAKAGYLRTIKDHTYKHRLQTILNQNV